jgi:hypothetical protein
MKKIIFLLIFVILILGCTEKNEKSITCQDYCKEQPHIMCVGHWEISGEYPNCNCNFVCETQENEKI